MKEPPIPCIGPESKASGEGLELFCAVVIVCSPSSSLNHTTVMPTGIAISEGWYGEFPKVLKGMVTAYDGILRICRNNGGGKVVCANVSLTYGIANTVNIKPKKRTVAQSSVLSIAILLPL
jgi:hypothetical protein